MLKQWNLAVSCGPTFTTDGSLFGKNRFFFRITSYSFVPLELGVELNCSKTDILFPCIYPTDLDRYQAATKRALCPSGMREGSFRYVKLQETFLQHLEDMQISKSIITSLKVCTWMFRVTKINLTHSSTAPKFTLPPKKIEVTSTFFVLH